MKLLKKILKILLRTRFGVFFVAFYLSISVPGLRKNILRRRKNSFLVLSPSRWGEDLKSLEIDGRIILCSLPEKHVYVVNSLFYGELYKYSGNSYFTCSENVFLDNRILHSNYIALLLRGLKILSPFSGMITCSYRYVQEVPWAMGAEHAGISFVAWHKEFTVLDHRFLNQRVVEARQMGFKFYGTTLACVNEFGKEFLVKSGIARPEQIEVVGLVRADALIQRRACMPETKNPRRKIVLFSFGHLTGPFPLAPTRNYYFSKDDKFGFVKLFNKVHAAFAEVSCEFEDIEFMIKPKNVEPGWMSEIEAAILAETGKTLEFYPNCSLTGDSAHALINQSMCNVVLNSTTVLESRMANVNTIMPLFAEAAEIHKDKIYFADYLDLFTVANSLEQFKNQLRDAAKGVQFEQGTDERLGEFLHSQIGNSDGQSSARLIDLLLRQ